MQRFRKRANGERREMTFWFFCFLHQTLLKEKSYVQTVEIMIHDGFWVDRLGCMYAQVDRVHVSMVLYYERYMSVGVKGLNVTSICGRFE